MGSVRVHRVVSVPANIAWDAIADLGSIHHFNPYLTGSHVVDEAEACCIGTERVCDLKAGGALRERVIEWVPGESYTVEVEMEGAPVDDVHTRMAVRPIDDRRCEVSMESSYRMRYGIAGRVADALVMRHLARRGLGKVLTGLDRHLAASANGAASPTH